MDLTKNFTVKIIAVITLLAIIHTPLWAEIFVLKDGKVFEGEIIKEDDKQIELKTEYGALTLSKSNIKQIAKDVKELLKPADELWQQAKACYYRALELREYPTAKNKELLKGKNLLYEAHQGYDEIRQKFPQQKYAWLDQKKKEILELMKEFRSARVRETKEEDQESYKPEPSTKELDEDKGVPFIKESEKATAKEKEWICPRCHGTCSVECDACSGTGYKTVKCPSCKGTGVCQRCKGYGKYTIRGEHPRRMHICTSCKGTGKCSRCGGTGIIREWKCSKCKGTGRLKCPDCGGKGTVASRLAQIQPKGLKDKQLCKRDIRKKRLSLNGGSAKTESAVLAGLMWLARHQNPDGSWGAASFQNQCKGTRCSGTGSSFFDTGLTGLALLAFTGATYTPASKDVYGGIRFGDVVRKAVLYLKNIQRDDGAFGSPGTGKFMYNQAIATYALADLVALMQDKGEVIGSVPFRGHVLKGINFILRSQNPGKAWRYRPRCGDNDASVTSWCAMALKAAEEGVLYVPETVWTGVKSHLDDVTHENGTVGYIQKGGVAILARESDAFQNRTLYTPPSLTAIGIMIRIFMGENRNSETIKKGARLLLKNLPEWDTSKRGKVDYYYWFCGSYALYQYDGPKQPNINL